MTGVLGEKSNSSHHASSQMAGLGAWFMVAVVILLVILSYVDRAILSLFGDLVRRDLGLSDQQLGLLFGLGFIAPLALVTLGVGWAVDRYNRVAILLLGLITWSVMTALCGLVSGFGGLLLARGGVGAGEAVVGPAGYALVGDRFPPERRGRAIGAIAAAVSVGTGIALILGGLLLDWVGPDDRVVAGLGLLKNWQFCFLLLGCAGLPMIPLVLMLKDKRPQGQTSGSVKKTVPILAQIRQNGRILFAIIGCGILNVAAGTGAVAWTAIYMNRHFGVPPAEAGIMLGTMSMIGGLVGAPVAAELSDRFMGQHHLWGRMRAHPLYFVLMISGSALVALSPTPWGVALGFLVIATMLAAINAISYSAIQDVSRPATRGRMIAVLQFATLSLGYGIGPSLVPLVSEAFGESTRSLGLAVLATIAPLAVLGIALSAMARGRYIVVDEPENSTREG